MARTMKLRCKVGPHAGQVLEYPRHVGEHLLGSGQAEWPGDEGGAAAETATRPQGETRSFPVHTGGGWYELSDGSKVQGKDNAATAQKELEG